MDVTTSSHPVRSSVASVGSRRCKCCCFHCSLGCSVASAAAVAASVPLTAARASLPRPVGAADAGSPARPVVCESCPGQRAPGASSVPPAQDTRGQTWSDVSRRESRRRLERAQLTFVPASTAVWMSWANSASESPFLGEKSVCVSPTSTLTAPSFVIRFRPPSTSKKYSALLAILCNKEGPDPHQAPKSSTLGQWPSRRMLAPREHL